MIVDRHVVYGRPVTYTDSQVRALLDAYCRPENEVLVEQPVTCHKLGYMGLVKTVLTADRGYVVVLTDKGKDLVWGWHNPDWQARAAQADGGAS